MAAAIRGRLAASATRLGEWVEVAARFRDAVRKEVSDPEEKNRLYRKFLDSDPTVPSEEAPEQGSLEAWLKWLQERSQQ
jgi:hypothetical protein